jgi:hypothetical protein
MGIIRSDDACIWDNPYFPPGATPKIIVATVHGVEKLYDFEFLPVPDNGMYYLTQISGSQWQFVGDIWTHTLTYLENNSQYLIESSDFSYCFACVLDIPRSLIFINQDIGMWYAYGTVVVGWFGPTGTSGSLREDITLLGIAKPEKAQCETNGTPDDKVRVRVASEYDHTCVYIKKL